MSRQAAAAIVGLLKIARGGNADDIQRQVASITHVDPKGGGG
jgi:hypothetical protein